MDFTDYTEYRGLLLLAFNHISEKNIMKSFGNNGERDFFISKAQYTPVPKLQPLLCFF